MDDDSKSKDDKLISDLTALEKEIPGPHKKGIAMALEGGGLVLAIFGVVLVAVVAVLVILVLIGTIR